MVVGALSVACLGGLSVAGCEEEPEFATPSDGGSAPPLYPSAAEALFEPGTRHRLETGEAAVSEVVPAGVLKLPTGRLVAVDPGWTPSAQRLGLGPFTETVAPGEYPLTLALLRWDDFRVAAARLTIADQPVTSWELAVLPGQDPATLRPGEFFGVGVDAATMAMFDAAAFEAVARIEDSNPDALHPWHHDRPVVLEDVVPGANVITFLTGWGDGSYPVWIGRARDGALVCFLVDMRMVALPATTTETPWSPRRTARAQTGS